MTSDNLDKYQDRPAVAGTVEKFEGKNVVIATVDGQRLLWPIKNLPEGVEVGSAIRLILSTAKTDDDERQQMAKTILNEILKDTKNNNEKQR